MNINEKTFTTFRKEVSTGFSKIEQLMYSFDQRMESFDQRLNETNNRIDGIRSDVGHLHHIVYKLDAKVDGLQENMIIFMNHTGDYISKLENNFESRLTKLEVRD